jgi:dienelactone hydrolase
MRTSTWSAILLATCLTQAALAAGKDVTLKASDGVALRASYFSPGKPGPGVVLLHMCNSQRTAWTVLAERLAARGFHVIALDYRGYGESEGKRFDTMPFAELRKIAAEKWPTDIDLAFEHLAAQPGVDRERIGAAGGSCGVNEAVQLARRHREVKTVVMLSGNTDRAGEEFLIRTPWMPVLASAAHDDGRAVETTRWVMGFSSNPMNQFREYDQGGHGTDMFKAHPELVSDIVAWFERHLITQPVRAASGPARPGPSAQLAEKLRAPGAAARLLAEVRSARKSGAPAALPPAGVINAYGYEHLQAGRAAEAIELLTVNVEAFPDSANAYDSLSDAYLAAKDTAKAREYAQKALDALPRDTRAGDGLKEEIRKSARQKLGAR